MPAELRGPIRIGFVLTGLIGGGAERSMLSIIDALDRTRFEPLLVLFTPTFDYDPPAGVEVLVLEGRGRTGPGRLLARARELAALARRTRLDLLVSFLLGPNIVAIAAGRRAGVPVVAGERSAPSLVLDRSNRALSAHWLWARLVRRFYPRAAAIVANTRGAGDELTQQFGVAPDRVRVVPNAIDLHRIRTLGAEPRPSDLPADGPVLVHVGRFSFAKDHATLLRAFAIVRRTHPARLVLVGSGEDEPQVRALCASLGLEDAVVFTGFRSNPYAYLAGATLSVLTSRFEGLPNAILESMALGVPVVSTACRYGPIELLEGSGAGVLVPVGDAPAFARAVTALLDDPARRERLAAAGLARAETFARARVAGLYEELFASVARTS